MSELTSIVIIITVPVSTIDVLSRFVVTSCIICSTLVAKLMAASASHVVAALSFLDIEFAHSAFLCSRLKEPILECLI